MFSSETSPATHGTSDAIASGLLGQWNWLYCGIVRREARTHLQSCFLGIHYILTMKVVFITVLRGYSYFFSYLNHKTYCTNPCCGKSKSVHLLTICQIFSAVEHFLSERRLYHILFCKT